MTRVESCRFKKNTRIRSTTAANETEKTKKMNTKSNETHTTGGKEEIWIKAKVYALFKTQYFEYQGKVNDIDTQVR